MTPLSSCCGSVMIPEGGAIESFCNECFEPMCSACASTWEGDYSCEGEHWAWCGYALCRACEGSQEWIA
jgi:hypothetical protein